MQLEPAQQAERHEQLTALLQASGWKMTYDRPGLYSRWTKPRKGRRRPGDVDLSTIFGPANSRYGDYEEVIDQALATLAYRAAEDAARELLAEWRVRIPDQIPRLVPQATR